MNKPNKSNKLKNYLKNKWNKTKLFVLKNKKTIKLLLLILVALVIISGIYFNYLKARFAVKEDLEVDIGARHLSFDFTKDNPAKIAVPINIDTSSLCRATCTEQLINTKSNNIVFSKNFTFKKIYREEYEQIIYPSILGEGQEIYVFSVSCTNIQTTNCPAQERSITKDVIITIDRRLTREEKNLKASQEETLNFTYSTLNSGLSKINESSQIISKMKYAKKNDLEDNANLARIESEKFKATLLLIDETWLTRDHELMAEKINEKNITSAAQEFNAITSYLLEETSARIPIHNSAVNQSYELSSSIIRREYSLNEGKQFLTPTYSALNSDLKNSKSLLFFVTRSIKNKDFSKYSDLLLVLSNVNNTLNQFDNKYLTQLSNNTQIVRADFDLIYSEEENCAITNQSLACNKNSSVELFNFSSNNYFEVSNKISNICSRYSKLSDERAQLYLSISQKRMNLSAELISQINSEEAKYKLYLLNKHKEELSTRNDSSAQRAIQVINNYIFLIESEYGTIINESSSFSFNYSLFTYFLPSNFILTNMTDCFYPSIKIDEINLSYEEFPKLTYSKYNYAYSQLVPLCCFDDKCVPCLNDSTTNYPLVMVHGHGFYSKNEPISPSQVYNNLQLQLLADNLYIPGGILREQEPIRKDTLGLVNASISYKASYYPEDLLNNESISSFADRLNVIIQKAKQETGKDKVIIMAHSMGGLVTREYLNLYGSEDIDKIIIIGTPNKGVTSETVAFCKLFGRNLECDEMHKDSKFIKKISNVSNPLVPVYTIRGVGCFTFGKDGDGIVQSESVLLPYAQNYDFNGSCSVLGDFHTSLPDSEQYPSIYNKIKELLQQ
ncbi:MAG: alpha/beta fold hydrolase [Candidatus Nanoarchaeia archaeon]